MVTLNYSLELDCNERNFFKILTDYENLSKYLPRQLQKIEILDEHDNYTTIQAGGWRARFESRYEFPPAVGLHRPR